MVGLLFLVSCRDGDPAGPDLSGLEIVALSGGGQAAEPMVPLPMVFRVRVQTRGNGAPAEGAGVRWDVVEGPGGTVEPSVSKTDSLGLSEARLTLGAGLGSYRVRAFLRGTDSPPAEFSAFAVLAPTLLQAPEGSVRGGDTILVRGSNFSSDPLQNIVTFSGIRGNVVHSAPMELQVEVPPCLVPREHELRVRVGSLATGPVTLGVEGGPVPLVLAEGEDRILDASQGLGCFFLPPDPESLYLVLPHSPSSVVGAQYPFSLTGLTTDGAFPSPGSWAAPKEVSPSPSGPGEAAVRSLDARDRWEEGLRALEGQYLAGGRGLAASGAGWTPKGAGSASEPGIGDKRVFKVLNAKDGFDRVTARVRFVSDHSLVYLDEKAPAGGQRPRSIGSGSRVRGPHLSHHHRGLWRRIGSGRKRPGHHPLHSGGKPAHPPGEDSFVGGFFFGLDLLPGREGSNAGEIFYAMVPDPGGAEGPAIGKFNALNTIPAVLAHEFEHMVHFNQRMLLRGAETSEALWLSEALAQMAEDLVGDAFERAREPAKALYYRSGNFIRARLFLRDPGHVSLLASLPPGTLAERGAGWLFLKQLSGRPGREGLLGTLASSTSSGIRNITDAVGLPWEGLVAEWAGALFLDGTSVPARPELSFPGVDLRSVLSDPNGSYPLHPLAFGGGSSLFSGTLWSSAPYYFIISPPAGGVSLNAGGPMGGSPEAGSELRVLVVRLQ